MNPLLDQLAVFALIAAAIGYFAFGALRKKKGACGGGCGCSVAKPNPLQKKA